MSRNEDISFPLFSNAGFELASIKTLLDAKGKNKKNQNAIYSRFFNPTVVFAEKQLESIENANWCYLCSSGMSAIDLAISSALSKSVQKHIIYFGYVYSGSEALIRENFQNLFGVKVTKVPFLENEEKTFHNFKKLIKDHPQSVVFFETVSNPLLKVFDHNSLIRFIKEVKSISVVDNTLPTGLCYRPLDQGADLVVSSLTKFYAGHNTLMAGSVSGNQNDLKVITHRLRSIKGNIISPEKALELCTFGKTFVLRFTQQSQSSVEIAKFLASHKKVKNIFALVEPKYIDNYSNRIAKKLFFSDLTVPVVTFELNLPDTKDSNKNIEKFIQKLRPRVVFGSLLGNVNTSIIHIPSFFSSGDLQNRKYLFRLSIGLEESREIIAAIEQAISEIS